MPVMHFEYTQFYYPGDMEFPRKYTRMTCGQAKAPCAAHYHFSFSSATKDVCLLQPYPIVYGPPDSVVVERVCSEPPEVGQNVGGRTDRASLP